MEKRRRTNRTRYRRSGSRLSRTSAELRRHEADVGRGDVAVFADVEVRDVWRRALLTERRRNKPFVRSADVGVIVHRRDLSRVAATVAVAVGAEAVAAVGAVLDVVSEAIAVALLRCRDADGSGALGGRGLARRVDVRCRWRIRRRRARGRRRWPRGRGWWGRWRPDRGRG